MAAPNTRPILWGRGTSTNVQKVIATAAELGLDSVRRDAGGPHGQTDTPQFAAMNPNRTVPVWQEGAFACWESNAILRHLARSHGALYGTGPNGMARVDQWLDWSALVCWPPVRMLFLDVWRDRIAQWDSAAVQAQMLRLAASLTIASRQIAATGHIAVPDLTIADIALGIGVNRLDGMPYPVAIPDPLRRWLDTLRARPSFALALVDEPLMTAEHV